MNKRLRIVKEFGLLLLLFVLASAVAVSEDVYGINVTIVQSSSSEDGGVSTVITTYNSETGLTDTSVISGSDSVITDDNEGDTAPIESTDPVDSGANDNLDQGTTQPDFQPDGPTYEEYSDEFSKWIQSILDESPLLMIGDFPQDITHIINVE